METLKLEQIIRDESIQQRVGGIQDTRVREYTKSMLNGDYFPPVIVFREGEKYWLADGFHRCSAAEELGKTKIEVDIKEGSKREAILYAVGANADHGIRRTNVDKRKSALTLLRDQEWQKWSDHEIAKRTRTTQPFISKLRRELTGGKESAHRKAANGRVMNTQNIGRPRKQTKDKIVAAVTDQRYLLEEAEAKAHTAVTDQRYLLEEAEAKAHTAVTDQRYLLEEAEAKAHTAVTDWRHLLEYAWTKADDSAKRAWVHEYQKAILAYFEK